MFYNYHEFEKRQTKDKEWRKNPIEDGEKNGSQF